MGVLAHEERVTGFPTSSLSPHTSSGTQGRHSSAVRSDGGQPVLHGRDAHATRLE
jgi:hypothetical protein